MNTCYNPFSLTGKTILITGASSGIGRQIAIDCSKMGAKIIITGRDEQRLNETLSNLIGEGHSAIRADLCDTEQIKCIVSEITEIDGAVLSAGRGLTRPVQFSTPDKMSDVFNINFFSSAELLRLLYKSKKAKKGASIVIIDSIAGITNISPGTSVYGATKAALNSFSKYCALEYAVRRIRVNCICPGMIDTPLIHRGTLTEEQLQEDASRYPCGRYGKTEDVANGAIYLLSDASSWVTGTSLFIDGGISLI